MKIMDILATDAVILNLGAREKRDVLADMSQALAKVEPQIEADRLLEVLLEREALQSTGIGEGVAIPHGKMVGLDRLVASFARNYGLDRRSRPARRLRAPARLSGPGARPLVAGPMPLQEIGDRGMSGRPRQAQRRIARCVMRL